MNKNLKSLIKQNQKQIKKWLSYEKNQYILLGFFFLVLQFFVFLGNYKADRYDVFFWFCNHTPLFFAFGFFLGKRDIIKGLINVGFLGQFAWTLDFLGRIFFNTHIFKMTAYVFDNPNGLWVLLPIGIHMFSTNLALYYTYKKKPNLLVAFYSLLYIMFLYSGTLTYTLPGNNVNCVQEICGFTELTFESYSHLWPIIVFFLIAMPTQAIQYGIYKLTNNKSNKNKSNKNNTKIT